MRQGVAPLDVPVQILPLPLNRPLNGYARFRNVILFDNYDLNRFLLISSFLHLSWRIANTCTNNNLLIQFSLLSQLLLFLRACWRFGTLFVGRLRTFRRFLLLLRYLLFFAFASCLFLLAAGRSRRLAAWRFRGCFRFTHKILFPHNNFWLAVFVILPCFANLLFICSSTFL